MSPSVLKHQTVHDQATASSFFVPHETLLSVKYIILHDKTPQKHIFQSEAFIQILCYIKLSWASW